MTKLEEIKEIMRVKLERYYDGLDDLIYFYRDEKTKTLLRYYLDFKNDTKLSFMLNSLENKAEKIEQDVEDYFDYAEELLEKFTKSKNKKVRKLVK